MQHKTLYYNVEPIAERLPDDCLKLIIEYASNKWKYENWFQTTVPKPCAQTYTNIIASICGIKYQYYLYHVPKNTSPLISFLISFEYFKFTCISCASGLGYHVYSKIYIPKLQFECDRDTFCDYFYCMVQLLTRVQKIE